MKNHLSDRINRLPISQTLAMATKARELKSLGRDIISLSLGEPDFNTPDFIKEAAIKAINDNYNSYTPVNGYLELRKAVCRKLKRDNELTYNTNQIVVSTGAKQALANVVMVLLNPGDEALLPTPFWVSYEAMVNLAEGISVPIPTSIENDFKITPQQLEEAITPKTKLIFFNSPNNPSGSVYSKEEYRALANVLVKYPNIYVISDEIYEHILFKGTNFSFARFKDMYKQTITVNGVSKSFAMTGWRIGYIAAPEFIAKACNKMQGQITSGANCIAQMATIAALDAPVSKIKLRIDEFKIRRNLVLDLLSKINGFNLNVPEGAFYVFPDISYYFGKTIAGNTINNASDFSMLLLEKANVATVTGDAFGQPNCIRLSYATSQELLQEAIKRITNLLN
ncbi:MAG: pyridoxal phosphate-dependent aminotransferase [Flavobacteriaceae bacterium]|nr:pyridoxal phosphate-dependent aminotransferase [Flavobacteriaceae bacterium]